MEAEKGGLPMGLRALFETFCGGPEPPPDADTLLLEEMGRVRSRLRQVENQFHFTAADETARLESLIYEMQALTVRMQDLIGQARRRGIPYPFYAMTLPERMWERWNRC